MRFLATFIIYYDLARRGDDFDGIMPKGRLASAISAHRNASQHLQLQSKHSTK